MITLNGQKFAESESEFTDSLFKAGGTCVGYAKRHKRRINLFDHNKTPIGLIKDNFLSVITILSTGEKWHSYGVPRLIQQDSSESVSYPGIEQEIYDLALSRTFSKPLYK